MVQEGAVSRPPAIVVVAGATASGKSEFAERLGEAIGGEIVNADSQQFYRGFDIGTGKVPLERRRLPHWLLDVCEPGERMTAMEFVRRAETLIADFAARGRVPILVGGTGLYLKALLEGLDDLPSRDPELRQRLEAEVARSGPEVLHCRLQALDPESAARISPQDPARLIRYLEIAELSGRAPSELMRRQRPATLRFPTETYWLQVDRQVLRHRIADRVTEMLAAGWLEEVRGLLARGIDPRQLEIQPIGYSELAEVAVGRKELTVAQEEIVQRTRAYAKRQDTFFRGMFCHSAYQAGGSRLHLLPGYPQAIS